MTHKYDEKIDLRAMKAKPFEKAKNVNYDMSIIEKKFDGARMLADVTTDDFGFVIVKLYSYSGFRFNYPNLEQKIKDALWKILYHSKGEHVKEFVMNSFYLDGELCYGDGSVNERSAISGRLNKALHGDDIGDNENIYFRVFDIVFKMMDIPLKERKDHLTTLLGEKNYSPLEIVGYVSAYNKANVEGIAKNWIDNGYEGVVIKDLRGMYKFGTRCNDWFKIKGVNTADLKCIGYCPGKGKYEGLIGSLDLIDKSGKYSVNVGSGMTDTDRSEPVEKYLGNIIEIKYHSLTETGSLFLPRFVKVRDDKTEEDEL